jgi:hypothetical protein
MSEEFWGYYGIVAIILFIVGVILLIIYYTESEENKRPVFQIVGYILIAPLGIPLMGIFRGGGGFTY